MAHQFYTCDVFTDTLFGGNPLAVIPDATGLSGQQMQAIAREFNYSETTFVLPAEQGGTRRVRIFGPHEEMPFAGHPNVGTAFVLHQTGAFGELAIPGEIVFEEIAGRVPIAITRSAQGAFNYELKAPESLSMGMTVAIERIAAVLSVQANDIDITAHQPIEASVGLPFVVTRLRSLKALAAARVNVNVLRELASEGVRPAMFVYTQASETDYQARMFARVVGTLEDPATGSANCALSGLLAHLDPRADAEFAWTVAQGVEMGRPSVLKLRAQKRDSQVCGVWVGGGAVMVSQGQIHA